MKDFQETRRALKGIISMDTLQEVFYIAHIETDV